MRLELRSYTAIYLLIILVLSGCAGGHQGRRLSSNGTAPEHNREPGIDLAKFASLQQDLMVLNDYADRDEAERVAEAALLHSTRLAQEYKIVRPAVLHNVLVRIGFKDRGLCYHWTTDLMQQLQQLELKTYRLYWGVAYRGSELREHNSVVIAGSGRPFDDGVVLDPWRYSGELFWDRVVDDRYPWKERPRYEW